MIVMCYLRSSRRIVVNDKTIRVDKCLEFLIPIYNNKRVMTLGCCCGHGTYPLTIIVQNNDGVIFELVSGIIIPRQKRFYIKDDDGLYYVSEVVMRKKNVEKINNGRPKHKSGHIYVFKPEHPFAHHNGYIFEHRLVMENYLRKNEPDHPALIDIKGKKYLSPKWVVHHWNENKIDNRPINLEVCLPNTHNTFYKTSELGKHLEKTGKDPIELFKGRL